MSRRISLAALDTIKNDTMESVVLQDVSNQTFGTRRSSRKSINYKNLDENLEMTKQKESVVLQDVSNQTFETRRSSRKSINFKNLDENLEMTKQKESVVLQDVSNQTFGTRRSSRKSINFKNLDENLEMTKQKKRKLDQETEVKDEPAKKKTKITEQKADIMKKEIKNDEEAADPNAGLSDYEKLVQANIAERMKFFESLGIFEDRDELKSLTRKRKPQRPTIKKNWDSLPSPINVHKRKHVSQEKRERSILTRPPAGPLPIEEYYIQADTEEFQTFLSGLQSLSISRKSESIWNRSKEEVLETMKKMKIPKENIARVVPLQTSSIAVHPTNDKILVLAGDNGGNLGLWNVEAKEDKGTHFFQPHDKAINRITIHPGNHNQIYTSSYDGSVRCTDLRSNSVCEVYNTTVVPSRDDYVLWHDHFDTNFLMVTTSYGTADKIDLRDPGKAVAKYHGHNGWSIDCVTCHPLHTQYFATSSADGYVHLWDMRNHNKDVPVATHLHGGSLFGIAFSPLTGKHLISTCEDNYVRFLSTDFTKFNVDKKIHHNNNTETWVFKFKPYWLPGQENLVALGAIDHPKRIAIMNSSGNVVHNFQGKLFATTTCSHAFHPTRPVAAGLNTRYVFVFSHV